MIGQTFYRLTVLEPAPPTNGKRPHVLCRCACGQTAIVRCEYLKNGHTRSCGCLVKEATQRTGRRAIRHGMSKSSEYHAWRSMKVRCQRETCASYKDYGGRGITVCGAWLQSFEAFLRDVGQRPSPLHSLDRINNNGNYEPGNVRWATAKQQRDNSRSVHPITYQGITLPLTDWARRVNLSQRNLQQRIVELRWDVARALTTPVRHYSSR